MAFIKHSKGEILDIYKTQDEAVEAQVEEKLAQKTDSEQKSDGNKSELNKKLD